MITLEVRAGAADRLDAAVLARLAEGGTRVVALRCAGFNNVDLRAADALDITVVRVPAYSPHAVSEFTVALLMALDRKIHRAWSRVRAGTRRPDARRTQRRERAPPCWPGRTRP